MFWNLINLSILLIQEFECCINLSRSTGFIMCAHRTFRSWIMVYSSCRKMAVRLRQLFLTILRFSNLSFGLSTFCQIWHFRNKKKVIFPFVLCFHGVHYHASNINDKTSKFPTLYYLLLFDFIRSTTINLTSILDVSYVFEQKYF